jgi:Protein of unknown function (DUF3822)
MANPLLEPTFSFTAPDDPADMLSDKKLCIEYGQFHISFCISNRGGEKIIHLASYQFKSRPDVAWMQKILASNPVYQTSFYDVILVHNQKEMVLVPSTMYKQHLEESLLQTIHGDMDDMIICNDDVHQWELNNIFGCNRMVFDAIRKQFPHVRNIHFSTVALRSIFRNIKEESGNWIKIFFYPSSIQVYAFKGDQLLLAQTFYYETKEDVIFHLLNLSDKYNIDLTEALVEVSGLVDEESGTWKELNRYVLRIAFEEPAVHTENAMQFKGIPSHFLTPILLIPKCV